MKFKIKLKSIKKFWRENTRGGVTVFICLVLIPVMMFTGLMTDLARIKLYHSEAAGTASSYADAVLSQYNEMLYDVYGLLSVTQDEEALKAFDVIKEYMEQATNTSNIGKVTDISQSELKYIPDNVVFVGMNNKLLENAWSPYGNTSMTLGMDIDKSGADGATLANKYVFASQVCDYMKIVGPVDLAWNGITDAINKADTAKENAELMNQRKTVDKNYNALDDKLAKLYDAMCEVNNYNEWDIPSKVSSYNIDFMNDYNNIIGNLVKLAGGKGGNNTEISNNRSKLGAIFEEIRMYSDAEEYQLWISDISTFSSNENPTLHSDNLLYKLYCYKMVITAKDEKDLKYHTTYHDTITNKSYSLGNLQNWEKGYRLTMQINDLEEQLNNKYDELRNELNDGQNGILKDINEVQGLLSGNTNFEGVSSEGIDVLAVRAEQSRQDLVDNCKTKSGNEMAEGLIDEYSFESKPATEDTIAINEVEGSDDILFVGQFDYTYLEGLYNNNKNYISAVDSLMQQDLAYLQNRLSILKSARDELVDYIDDQLEYLDKFMNEECERSYLIWNFEHKYGTYNFDIDSDRLIFNSDYRQNVLDRLTSDQKWFDISDPSTKSPAEPKNRDYSKLWSILQKWYGEGGSSGGSDAKTKQYKELLKKLKESLGNRGDAGQSLIEEFDGAVIPSCIENTSDKEPDNQSVNSLFSDDGDFNASINSNETKRTADYYITKLLMMDYDWNFFAGATFGKKTDNSEKDKLFGKTLKGEVVTNETNYLVRKVNEGSKNEFYGGAELEYIYWGNRDAQKNLTAVRTQITIIRAVENFASTYTIKEINNAILAIRNALAGFPVAALIVPPLIRAAIAMAETYMDLQALYEGKSIALYKSKIGHLTLLQDASLKQLLNDMFTADGGNSPLNKSQSSTGDGKDPIMFNYNQYVVLVTMMFCDTPTIIQRTQDLMELNMNHRSGVDLTSATHDSLKFKLSDASVGVKSTCSLDKMNLLILGGVFKDTAVSDYADESETAIMKDGFSYTVYRSY